MSFFIMMVSIVAVVLLVAKADRELYARRVRGNRQPKSLSKHQQAKYPEPHVMSWIGRQVMTKYNGIPEANKPVLDVRAAVVALDVKYGITRLDGHFQKHSGIIFSGPRCDCTDGRNRQRNDTKRHRSCVKYPEFIQLWDSMREVEGALVRLQQAEAQRERAIELAGIENDLRSVDAITEALRNERDLLVEVAREITA